MIVKTQRFVIAVLVALLGLGFFGPNTRVPSAQAASASLCTDSMKKISKQDAAKQAVTVLRGPAYATIWVNMGAVPSDAAWKIAKKNPSWGQTEVKIQINWGYEVHAYWAGGTFVRYSRNANCQARMASDFSKSTLPAKTLDDMLQWGLIDYTLIGKS